MILPIRSRKKSEFTEVKLSCSVELSSKKLYNLWVFLFQIQECVDLPFHTYKQLTACVRAVTASGNMIQTCRVCESTDQNVYDLTVYEFDASSAAWPSIKEVRVAFLMKKKQTDNMTWK